MSVNANKFYEVSVFLFCILSMKILSSSGSPTHVSPKNVYERTAVKDVNRYHEVPGLK